MKTLYWLLALWIASAITFGFVGDAFLLQNWKSVAESALTHDAAACRAMLASRHWNLPLESDPEWVAMERLLDLEIIPLPSPFHERASDDETLLIHWANAIGTNTQLSTRIDSFVRIESAGNDAKSQAANAGDSSERVEKSFRLTRALPAAGFHNDWWRLWTGCNAFGFLFAAVVVRHLRKQNHAEKSLLAPWLVATREAEETLGGTATVLPPLRESKSPLEPPLSLIAERLNQLIARLQNANERSELVLGNLQEGVLAVDERSRILLANTALIRLLELSEEHYLYRPLLEVVRIPALAQLIEFVLKEHVQREATIELGNASRVLRLVASPMPLGGCRQGALLTARDETMLKRIESVRRDFVTNASHELKTPLAAIRAYAETLQMGALDEREAAEAFVGNIITQADRINGLVQGMLQLSRVQAGTALRIEAFDAGEALQPCIAAAEAMAKSKEIHFSVNLEPNLTIRSDRDGFQTIVSNLLSNAVRYTPNQGSVGLTAQREENWLLLSVRDTGIGIAPQDMERIFERFYRAEKDRSIDTGGTGLGLSIVKHLVQALNGTVSAESQPKAGSRFDVRLPIRSDV